MKKLKKELFFNLFVCLFLICPIKAQIGINTPTPKGVLHIDGKGDTLENMNVSDDIIINSDGNIGIGNINPDNKLVIQTTGSNTGIKLPNGASSGKVLTSDSEGNAVWVSGAVQYQTMVAGQGGTTAFEVPAGSPPENNTKVNFFKFLVYDRAKDIYGAAYGWDDVEQHYIAPVSGLYRIALNAYFRTSVKGKNNRMYIFKNGSVLMDAALVSIIDAGSDQTAFTMSVVALNEGDKIDVRVSGREASPFNVSLYGERGHTFLLIESL